MVRPAGAVWTRSLCDFVYVGASTITSGHSSAGPKVDSAQPDVLGHTHNGRVWSRRGCHSHQSRGKAGDASDGAHAGTLWRTGLDSARGRSSKRAFQLVRMR